MTPGHEPKLSKQLLLKGFTMKSSMCAHKRGERYFTSYHWCNECPNIVEYRALERQQKLDWSARKKDFDNKHKRVSA
jgi:hypothetical protein